MSSSIFGLTIFPYMPFIIAGLFVLLSIPSLLVTGAKPEGVARAIACILWKTIGLVLIVLSVLQFGSMLIERQLPPQPSISVLILTLVVGIGIMVHASRLLAAVDAASKSVPKLVFVLTCESIGGLLVLVSLLTIFINFLLQETVLGLEPQLLNLFLGLLLMLGASFHVNAKRSTKKRK